MGKVALQCSANRIVSFAHADPRRILDAGHWIPILSSMKRSISLAYRFNMQGLYRHLCAIVLCGAGVASAQDVVFVAPMNHTMPLAEFSNGALSAGILKDLGEAIAARLGREARFVVVPSKRVADALREGRADIICYVLPEWIDGEFEWTQPFIPNAGMVVALEGAAPIESLADLARMPVGTIIGYRYPDLEQALGSDFQRSDGLSMEQNLRKLIAGRVHYAIVEQTTLDYFLRNHPDAGIKSALRFSQFSARCAISRQAQVKPAEIRRAVDELIAKGKPERILDRYR